jgi:hypothetical protein
MTNGMAIRQVAISLHVIALCRVGPRGSLPIKITRTGTGTTNLRCFAAVPLDFVRKGVESASFTLQNCVQNAAA